jgi:hypothetical protein
MHVRRQLQRYRCAARRDNVPEGLARVVSASTLISELDKRCRKARASGGRVFPVAVGLLQLDEAHAHRNQVGLFRPRSADARDSRPRSHPAGDQRHHRAPGAGQDRRADRSRRTGSATMPLSPPTCCERSTPTCSSSTTRPWQPPSASRFDRPMSSYAIRKRISWALRRMAEALSTSGGNRTEIGAPETNEAGG